MSLSALQKLVIGRCSSIYTKHIPVGSYNEFEGLLKDSINLVLEGLCTWEWEVFEWTESRTTNVFRTLNSELHGNVDSPSETSIDDEIVRFQAKTNDLLEWLGWDLWSDCERRCSWDVSTGSISFCQSEDSLQRCTSY